MPIDGQKSGIDANIFLSRKQKIPDTVPTWHIVQISRLPSNQRGGRLNFGARRAAFVLGGRWRLCDTNPGLMAPRLGSTRAAQIPRGTRASQCAAERRDWQPPIAWPVTDSPSRLLHQGGMPCSAARSEGPASARSPPRSSRPPRAVPASPLDPRSFESREQVSGAWICGAHAPRAAPGPDALTPGPRAPHCRQCGGLARLGERWLEPPLLGTVAPAPPWAGEALLRDHYKGALCCVSVGHFLPEVRVSASPQRGFV